MPAGKSVLVVLNATALAFTQVDEVGERGVLAGEYTFQFGIPETRSLGQGYAEHSVATTHRNAVQ